MIFLPRKGCRKAVGAKKILCLVLCGVLLCSGCGGRSPASSAPEPVESDTVTTTTTTTAPSSTTTTTAITSTTTGTTTTKTTTTTTATTTTTTVTTTTTTAPAEVTVTIPEGYTFMESMINSLGSGLGFMLAMILFAGVRGRMEGADTPEAFKGLPITLVAASIVSVSFFGFAVETRSAHVIERSLAGRTTDIHIMSSDLLVTFC